MAETIFSEMSRLALEHDAINLGQGFPDTPGPHEVVDAAVAAMHKGWNQYPPAVGIASLRTAIADHQRRWYGLDVAADGGVVVCSGASEALSSAMTALLRPGDEVIALEPYYDLYGATAQLLGAHLVPVRIHAPDYALDALGAAGGGHRPHAHDRAQHPAQPHRRGALARRAAGDRGRGDRARPDRAGRRGLRAPGVRRRTSTSRSRRCRGCSSARSPSARAARRSR